MNDFTASNGVRIEVRRPSDHHPLTVVGLGLIASSVVALREFFRAEEDERLGRWRWPENPDYVVYTMHLEDFERMFGPDLDAVILRESDGLSKGYCRSEDLGAGARWPHLDAARAYFDAHPEPKPAWHDAKPGEVWVLTTVNVGDEVAARVAMVNESLVFEYVSSVRTQIPITDQRFDSGRRIWPEET